MQQALIRCKLGEIAKFVDLTKNIEDNTKINDVTTMLSWFPTTKVRI